MIVPQNSPGQAIIAWNLALYEGKSGGHLQSGICRRRSKVLDGSSGVRRGTVEDGP